MSRRYIDLSYSASGQPFRSPTSLGWLEQAMGENYYDILNTIERGQVANGTILWGCEISSAAGNTTVTAGAVYVGGYIYRHGGSTFPDPTGFDVVIMDYNATTYSPDDPTTFADLSTHNIHAYIDVSFTTGTSGSGVADYTDLVRMCNATMISAGPSLTFAGTTIRFNRNQLLAYSGVSGSPSWTIDLTDAKEGVEVVVYASIASGTNFGASVITVPAATYLLADGGGFIASASRDNFVLKFIGYDTENVLGLGVNAPVVMFRGLN